MRKVGQQSIFDCMYYSAVIKHALLVISEVDPRPAETPRHHSRPAYSAYTELRHWSMPRYAPACHEKRYLIKTRDQHSHVMRKGTLSKPETSIAMS